MTAIVTPEGVRLDLEPAGLCSRMLSRLIDAVFQLMLVYAAASASIVFGDQTVAVVVFTAIASFLVVFGYPVLTEVVWQGRTIGKNALGLRLVTTDGGPVRFRHAAVRSMLQLVDFVVVPGGAIALISGATTARTQRLGDIAAGTFVVRERERRTVADATPVTFPPPYGLDAYVRSLDIATVTAAQYATVRSFLLRVPTLASSARVHLARRLAVPLARELCHTPPAQMPPELFLVCVASAYQLHHGAASVHGAVAARSASTHPPRRGLAPPPPPPAGRRGGVPRSTPSPAPPFRPPS